MKEQLKFKPQIWFISVVTSWPIGEDHLQWVESSFFTPWQKLDTFHTFIQLCVAYTMHAATA